MFCFVFLTLSTHIGGRYEHKQGTHEQESTFGNCLAATASPIKDTANTVAALGGECM